MLLHTRCLDCGRATAYDPAASDCPHCGGQWRAAEYDYAAAGAKWDSTLTLRPFDMWRYYELLPVSSPDAALRLGEGGTPLIPARNLRMMLGRTSLFIKDERQGPTGSFKDRQAALTIAALREAGITEMVAASTGNVAISYSAYAARAGIKLWAFVTSLVPDVKMREIALYGSQVVKVTGSYDQAKEIAAEFARQRGLFLDRGARTISSLEAMKTIAYEIAEQLGTASAARSGSTHGARWRAPDWYIQSVSGGMGPLGVFKGFEELRQMGWIEKLPAMGLIQVEGCAPMVQSYRVGLEKAAPVDSPRTHIETLATGDPGRAYTLLRQDVMSAGGTFESVTDEEAFRAMHTLAKMEGLSTEPAAAVAFAGLFKLVRAGLIGPDDMIVVNCTGHTMPAEETLFAPHWTRDIDVAAQPAATPQEGLLAALSQVAPRRFPRVAVIDDHADARQLIRRILQAQGDYTILEAGDGPSGIELTRRERPDLVILDLMMPGMDGFQVLDALKAEASTAGIPVIVATAKELTAAEKA
ncbi:MAG: pyridoxal-phosphate dependent enzyme, partial [Anaerolineales bacterium]